MKQVILDTSFIISCIKNKIDFFEKLEHDGFQIIIPEQTIDELMGLGAKTALKILETEKFRLVKIPGRDADTAIVNFVEKNHGVVVATLDKGLQKKIKTNKMVIRGTKKIEVI